MKTFEHNGRKVEILTQDAEWTRKNGVDIWVEDSNGIISFRELVSTEPGAVKRAKQIIDFEVGHRI